jgi:hypothetical protein
MQVKNQKGFKNKETRLPAIIDFKIALIISSLVSLPIFYKITRDPILYPFVDDWVLAPWLLGNEEVSLNALIQLVNGHQHSLIKFLLFIHGYLFGSSLQVIAILVTLLATVTFAQLAFLTLGGIPFKNWLYLIVSTFSVTSILFTPRQFQNFFLIICAPWIMSLFFITTYFVCAGVANNKLCKSISIACLALAPFSNGLGLALPIFVLLKSFLSFVYRDRVNLQLSKITVCLVTISISQILPRLESLFPTQGSEVPGVIEESQYVFGNSIEAAKFVFVSFSNPLVPWSPMFLNFAIGIGLGIAIFIMVFYKASRESAIKWFFEDNQILTLGILFSLSLLISRFSALNVIGAIEPRYTTGSILIIAGTLRLFLKSKLMHETLIFLILIGSLVVYLVGLKTGFGYYTYRHQQSVQIQNCFLEQPRVEPSAADDCIDLIFENSLGISREDLEVNLDSLSISRHF